MVDYNDLIDGPILDGEPTWFTIGAKLPEGWEGRYGINAKWKSKDLLANTWYQVRPAKLADPVTLAYGADDVSRIVLWKEMKDRPDLDQWQYLRANGTWHSFDEGWHGVDGWPLRVRRRRPDVEGTVDLAATAVEVRIRRALREKLGYGNFTTNNILGVLEDEGLL